MMVAFLARVLTDSKINGVPRELELFGETEHTREQRIKDDIDAWRARQLDDFGKKFEERKSE